jgi:Domain of unknown function (DUF4340)
MTTELAQRRKKHALSLMVVAGVIAAVAAVTLAIEARSARPDLASGLVIPGLEQRISGAQKITVASKQTSYRIERIQRGQERVWAMRDRGDYPVLASRLAQLTEGLQQLTYVRRMTSDASKHERLGVGDPRQGGEGVLVQIEDGRGAFLVNLIFGVQPDGFYVRRPDQDQTWAVRGDLPPLRDIAEWLDLAPLTLDASTIARVEVQPADGRAYVLSRASPNERNFAISEPAGAQIMTPTSATETAERITHLSPIDVQPAPAIQGQAQASVRAATFDGVTVEAELIETEGKTWVKFVAHAAAPEQEAAALAINDRAAGWAYALSDTEADALAPTLESFLPPHDAEPAPR